MKSNLDDVSKLALKLYETAPKKESSLAGSLLSTDHLIQMFRLHMVRIGFRWAEAWPFPVHEIPEFSTRADEGVKWILKMREVAQEESPTTPAKKNA